MITMGIMHLTIHKIIDVVTMRYRFVLRKLGPCTCEQRKRGVQCMGFARVDCDDMFVDMILVRMVQMAIVKVVHMAVVPKSRCAHSLGHADGGGWDGASQCKWS